MRKTFIILILIIVATISGCAKDSTSDESIAKVDIENRGYEIVETKGEILRSILDKKHLLENHLLQIWGVQIVSPDEYIGKEIITYEYIVKNHPLTEKEEYLKYDSVNLYYMFSEGSIIGGYSSIRSDEVLYGGIYSIDGKVLEEVIDVSFKEWSDTWNKKYFQ